MKDNVSPEEKLLRLIRVGKKQDISTEKNSVSIMPSPITDLKPKLKPSLFSSLQKYLSSFSIRKIIWVLFAVSCLYLIGSFAYPLFGFKQIKLSEAPDEKVATPDVELKQSSRPLEFYMEGVQNRQIFARTSPQIQEAEQPISGTNTDLIKDISLIGIISGENPQAVIEDKKTQKTYYVTKGQFIGQFEVKEIQEGKVILGYNNQRYELYI